MNPRLLIFIASIYLGLGLALLQTYSDLKDTVNVILTVMTVIGFTVAVWDFFSKE
ncbi:MAG: hypothetical protein SFU98_02530 [Leptospiraceae bacterium]|nr:hypothetical protein [Leptospiraceae bacterium]